MQEYQTDSLSSRLPSLLPEHLRAEAPAFESFLKAYFEYLESEIVTLSSQQSIDTLILEDGVGSLLLEPATVSPSPTQDSAKIITEETLGNANIQAAAFKKGEYIVGSKSKSVAEIKIVAGDKIYVKSIEGHGFEKEETITGKESRQTGVIGSYKHNNVLATNRLLDYSDIDRTSEDFLQYFQNDLIPSLDLGDTINRRLTIKNIRDLYQTKGTSDSVKFLMRILYGENATIRYPNDETIYLNDSGYNEVRRIRVVIDSGLPVATDRVIQYKVGSTFIEAEAVIENVYIDDLDLNEYSLEVTEDHRGTFVQGKAVTFIDRDGLTEYTGTVLGVVAGVGRDSSSTYMSHDDDGDVLLETGDGVLLEQLGIGSLYSYNDVIEFTGSKLDTIIHNARGAVDGLSRGGVEKIFIDTEGTNYEGGDLIVFENLTSEGGGAEAVLGSVGDEVVLENATVFGQFEITATAGQTQFGGPGVTDDAGRSIFFNDAELQVYVDDILYTPNTNYTTHDYSHRNDRVVFTTPLTAGQRVDLYTSFDRLQYEDGDNVNNEITTGRIRSVKILNGGAGYSQVPACFPGGYIYLKDLTGFIEGEVVSGSSFYGAESDQRTRATIIRIEPNNGRLVVKRLATHEGEFVDGEVLTGETSSTTEVILNAKVSSGTGGRLFAYSDNIGGIKSINLQNQGSKFTSNAVLSDTSFFPMLISTPTAIPNQNVTITGVSSGSTGVVIRYDATRHILVYKNLDGLFLDNEVVTYNNTDQFRILKSNPYNGIGQFAGEGILQEQFVTDKGQLNNVASNLQDSKYYQSHSYVIKVAESINKYRSVVKDLLHPAGHIFFGEVAIENSVTGLSPTSSFLPTIIMVMKPVLYVPNALSNSIRTALLHADMTSTGNHNGTQLLVLDESGQPVVNTDPRTGGSITEPDTEYGDSSMRSRHMNILKIVNKSIPSVNIGNARGVVRSIGSLNLQDNQKTLDYHNRKYVAADQGKIQDVYTPHDESIVMENGDRIEYEETACILCMEESVGAIVKGERGFRMISEDDETLIRLESATTINEPLYFISERNAEYGYKYVMYEDGDRIVFEDGMILTSEERSENSVSTFASFGPSFKSINTISGQRTYRISYFIKDEEDDGLMMEDGYGNLLDERSQTEGLRIHDLNNHYIDMFIPEFEARQNKRTNITYSAYVKSA
jgi:hypothetical protein